MGHVNITHMLCSHIYSCNILHTSTMRSSNLVAHHVSYWEWWNYQTVVILAHMSCPMSLSDHVVLASLCLSSQIHPLCLSIRPGHSGIISVWSQNICAWNIYLIWCNQNKLRVIFPLKREYNFDYINVSYHWEYSSHRRSLRNYIFICTLYTPYLINVETVELIFSCAILELHSLLSWLPFFFLTYWLAPNISHRYYIM